MNRKKTVVASISQMAKVFYRNAALSKKNRETFVNRLDHLENLKIKEEDS